MNWDFVNLLELLSALIAGLGVLVTRIVAFRVGAKAGASMEYGRGGLLRRITCGLLLLTACQGDGVTERQTGDLAKTGGSATVRREFEAAPDDPFTSDDESNNQPVGYFGTLTMAVDNLESGNSYTLDVELDGTSVERVYFPKGGWVDFYSCELDEDLVGACLDEESRTWNFNGESAWGASPWVEEEEEQEHWGIIGDEDDEDDMGETLELESADDELDDEPPR